MGKKFDFQYLILGGGAAGSAVATVLAKAKKKVAVIDEKITEKAAQKLADGGVAVIFGHGIFKDSHTIGVLDQDFTAETIIVATGRRLDASKIDGAKETKFLTAENAMRIRKMPRTALVIGGGADGCRVAERLAKNEVKTVLAEKTSRLMPKEDAEVGKVFGDYFKKDLKMMLLTGTEVSRVENDKNGNFEVIFAINGQDRKVKVNAVVVATEKKPATAADFAKAGIKYGANGIKVDKMMRTNVKNIYAVGGVTGGETSRERANYAGTILGQNLATRGKNLFNYHGFVKVTKTFPEVATIGVLENELKLKKIKYKKAVALIKDTEASEKTGFNRGFVKILADRQGRILGATIVAPGAEAMIQELVLAMRHQMSIVQVAGTPHPLGEFGVAVKMAARKLALKLK